MRSVCLNCVRRRLSHSMVLADDVEDVDEGFWYMVGSLQDAYTQLMRPYPGYARRVLAMLEKLLDASNEVEAARSESISAILSETDFNGLLRDLTEEQQLRALKGDQDEQQNLQQHLCDA